MRESAWPSTPGARDRWVLDHRGPRPSRDPAAPPTVIVEQEPAADGSIASIATIFLTGRECPWRCVMCDLWKGTIPVDTPLGAVPRQLGDARRTLLAAGTTVTQMKLYNAGSFFDPRAVPERDYDAIAARLDGIDRVIVESHPSLIGGRVDMWLDALARHASGQCSAPRLEVAMGLETAHPVALEHLNKRMTTDEFRAAAERLERRGVALRVFLLIGAPFIARDEQDEWLLKSIGVALSSGAAAISLLRTRSGNGAMEALAARGMFAPPTLRDVERSYNLALARAAGRARIFVDLWDLEQAADCRHCLEHRRARLHAMNLSQRVAPPVACGRCAAS
jgi:radical SAM enzyme (TIGR01210 family)